MRSTPIPPKHERITDGNPGVSALAPKVSSTPTVDHIELTAKKNERNEHVRKSSALSTDTFSTIPQSGRKRAFSDPGDVKRPSTAGTDRLPESQTQEPYSLMAAQGVMAEPHPPVDGGQSRQATFVSPSLSPEYLPLPAHGQYAMPPQMTTSQAMAYQGFEYIPYADVSSRALYSPELPPDTLPTYQPSLLQYYAFHPISQLPTFGSQSDQPTTVTRGTMAATENPGRNGDARTG